MRAEGNIEEAMAHFTEAFKSKPDDAEAYRNLGSVLLSQGRPAKAIAQYRQSLRIKPEDAAAHYNLGVILAGQSELAKAAVHYRQTLLRVQVSRRSPRPFPNRVVSKKSSAP